MADGTNESATVSDIPPALTAREWANLRANPLAVVTILEFAEEIGRHHAVLAIANAGLHDEDPRKIRREHVELLRQVADDLSDERAHSVGSAATVDDAVAYGEQYSALLELADVLESYLPPKP